MQTMINQKKPKDLSILLSMAALSASGIAMEVSLTRLFSFLFTHSYVYLIISISMAGIGLGAVLNSIISKTAQKTVFFWAAILQPLLLLAVIPQYPGRAGIYISLVAAFLFYICLGMFQALVFKNFSISPGRIYSADLIGASTGAIIAFLMLNQAGGLYSCMVFAVTAGISCIAIYYLKYSYKRRLFLQLITLTAAILILAYSTSVSNLLPLKSLEKEMTLMLENTERPAEIKFTRWSSFGRADMVETDNPLFKTIFIDGAAGTKMIRMDEEGLEEDIAHTLSYQYMAGVPMLGIDESLKEDALIIGSGGGIDVVTAMINGYKNIDAVELNPDFIKIVQEQSDYNGGIYNGRPGIRLIEGEGRAFVRSTNKKYDLLLMSLPIIKSSRNYGNQALTENYLFTHNAFSEYLGCLKESGIILVVAHYPNELLKLAVNAAAALEKSGKPVEEAMKHIITIGRDNSPVILIKKNPFTIEETQTFYTLMAELSVRGSTNFIPGFSQRSKSTTDAEGNNVLKYEFHPGLYNLSTGSWDFKKVSEMNSERISVVTDDSPFFYQMNKKIPSEVMTVVLICILLIIIYLIIYKIRHKSSLTQISSFGLIGTGFMLIEIAYLQKFIFYWQHQTLALTIVLSIILLSCGAGSYVSERISSDKFFRKILIVLASMLVILYFTSTPILNSTEGNQTTVKLLISILLLTPVFFLMGMPFSYMMRRNRDLNNSRKEFPWMMGFNSIASLLGGSLSMAIAITAGYQIVMFSGIAAYLILIIVNTYPKID